VHLGGANSAGRARHESFSKSKKWMRRGVFDLPGVGGVEPRELVAGLPVGRPLPSAPARAPRLLDDEVFEA
jgi:hypothetical protein